MRIFEFCAKPVSLIAGGSGFQDGVGRQQDIGDNWKRRDILLVSFHDMVTVPGTTAQRIGMLEWNDGAM